VLGQVLFAFNCLDSGPDPIISRFCSPLWVSPVQIPDDCSISVHRGIQMCSSARNQIRYFQCSLFRLDALALSVIATATWLAGWLGGCHTPVLYQKG